MASLIPRLDSGKWNYGDLAFGLRSGLILNRGWVSTINAAYRNDKEQLAACLPLLLTRHKVNKLKDSFPFIQDHSRAINWGIASILILNFVAIAGRKITYHRLSNIRTPLNKFLFITWKITPYLALVTNIALLSLEAKSRPMKTSAALLMTGISLLDLTPWMPRSFGWYMSVGVRLPIDMVAFYYGSNLNRFRIVASLILTPETQRFFYTAFERLKRQGKLWIAKESKLG